jgi:protein gp37
MSKIEWTEATWNPIVGCSVVSPGCARCYAMMMAARLERMNPALTHYQGLTKSTMSVRGVAWTGKIDLAPAEVLRAPLKRRKPTTYFVNSMGDLFHESIPDEVIDKVFAVMVVAKQHTFQVLTKRSKQMQEYMERITLPRIVNAINAVVPSDLRHNPIAADHAFRNIWLGVSCEDQRRADERIPDLLATPAAVRFVSAEPLLGPIDLEAIPRKSAEGYVRPLDGRFRRLDWIIVGGESGRGARPMHPDWARSIRDQCNAAGVPFFFKQWGAFRPDRDAVPSELVNAKRELIVSSDGSTTCGLLEYGPAPIVMKRTSKRRAGRLLDGREWSEMPGASKYDQQPTDPHHGGKVPA